MCVPGALPTFGAAHLLPSMRSPVPQSRMICVPSGAISSRQGVFPPYRHVAGSTVGVDPRTPQKLSLAMGTVIALRAKPLCEGSLRANTRTQFSDGNRHCSACKTPVRRLVTRQHACNRKLVSWSQPRHGASIYSRRQSVIVRNKRWKGLHLRRRAGRIWRMAAHSHEHDHSHAGHSHFHDHGHAGHGHAGHSHPTLSPSVLGWAMAVTLGLVVAEIFGGILGRSVALLNDAVHNLSDVPALGIFLSRHALGPAPRRQRKNLRL